MNIVLVIDAIFCAALILYLLTKKEDPPAPVRKTRPGLKREAPPEQGK